MSPSASQNEDDLMLLILILGAAVSTGAISFGVFLAPARAWMLQHHLLVDGDGVVIPFVDGIGFGWPQLLIAGGLLIGLVVLAAWLRGRARDRV